MSLGQWLEGVGKRTARLGESLGPDSGCYGFTYASGQVSPEAENGPPYGDPGTPGYASKARP